MSKTLTINNTIFSTTTQIISIFGLHGIIVDFAATYKMVKLANGNNKKLFNLLHSDYQRFFTVLIDGTTETTTTETATTEKVDNTEKDFLNDLYNSDCILSAFNAFCNDEKIQSKYLNIFTKNTIQLMRAQSTDTTDSNGTVITTNKDKAYDKIINGIYGDEDYKQTVLLDICETILDTEQLQKYIDKRTAKDKTTAFINIIYKSCSKGFTQYYNNTIRQVNSITTITDKDGIEKDIIDTMDLTRIETVEQKAEYNIKVAKFVNGLNDFDKSVFELSYVGFTQRETAKKTKCTKTKVQKHLQAMKKEYLQEK